MLLHLDRPAFDGGLIFGRTLRRVNTSSIATEDVFYWCCLYHRVIMYRNVHTNLYGLHSGRRIFDITPPTLLSVSHINMSTVPIVAVGKEWRTKMGQSGFLNRQTPYSNYLEVAGGLSAVNAFGTQLRDLINLGLIRWRLTG